MSPHTEMWDQYQIPNQRQKNHILVLCILHSSIFHLDFIHFSSEGLRRNAKVTLNSDIRKVSGCQGPPNFGVEI